MGNVGNDTQARICIVEARFYDDIAEELLAGACAYLQENGAVFTVLRVPGALEIPAAIAMAIASAPASGSCFDGYIALGCVIRGETGHYDVVAGESARGIHDLACRHGLAIGNGILTTDNRAQAWARADRGGANKGRAAAVACLQMVSLRQTLANPVSLS